MSNGPFFSKVIPSEPLEWLKVNTQWSPVISFPSSLAKLIRFTWNWTLLLGHLACPVLWDSFQYVQPWDVDRILRWLCLVLQVSLFPILQSA